MAFLEILDNFNSMLRNCWENCCLNKKPITVNNKKISVPLDRLKDDVLVHISHFLGLQDMQAMALTSKCLNRLHPRMACNRFDLIPQILRKAGLKFDNIPPFWQEQITKAKEKVINPKALGLGGRLQSFALKGNVKRPSSSQHIVSVLNQYKINQTMPNLTNLDLRGFPRQTAEAVQQIVLSLKKLTSFTSPVVDDSFLQKLSEERLPIKQLKGELGDITDIGAQYLAGFELEKLELRVPNFGNRKILNLSAPNLHNLAQSFRSLKKLTCYGIDDSLLHALADARVPLKSLTAINPWFEDGAVPCLRQFPLTNFKLINPQMLTDEGIKALAELPQSAALRTLSLVIDEADVNDFTLDSYDVIATRFPNLRELSIKKVPDAHEMALSRLAKGTFKALTVFKLYCTRPFTEEEVVQFLEKAQLPALQKLTLPYGTDRVIAGVQQLKNPLRHFKIRLSDQLTDRGVAALSLSHHRLESLVLNSTVYERITDKSLKSIANGTMQLDELYLDELDKITDDGLIALAESKKPITKLTIKNHYARKNTAKVTDLAIQSMRNFGLPREELEIDFRNLEVTKASLNTLALMPLKKLKVQAMNTMFDEDSLKVFRSLCRADEVVLEILRYRGAYLPLEQKTIFF